MDKNTGWIADLMRRFDEDVQATRKAQEPERERERLWREQERIEAERSFRRLLGILRGERPTRDVPGMLPVAPPPMPPAR